MIKEEDAQVRLKVEVRGEDGKWKRSKWHYISSWGELVTALADIGLPPLLAKILKAK